MVLKARVLLLEALEPLVALVVAVPVLLTGCFWWC